MELHNTMEDLVEEHIDAVMAAMECCGCAKCRLDVMALALNSLPCKYVATEKGAMFAKVDHMMMQMDTDVISALSSAAAKVKGRPKH